MSFRKAAQLDVLNPLLAAETAITVKGCGIAQVGNIHSMPHRVNQVLNGVGLYAQTLHSAQAATYQNPVTTSKNTLSVTPAVFLLMRAIYTRLGWASAPAVTACVYNMLAASNDDAPGLRELSFDMELAVAESWGEGGDKRTHASIGG